MNLGGAVRFNKTGLIFIAVVGFLILIYAFGGRGLSGDGGVEILSGSFKSSSGPSGRTHETVSLKALLVAAIDVAQRGGLEVVAVRKGAVELEEDIKGKTKEGVKDSATQGDYRSHRVMYYGLRKAFPGVKVISEEHTEAPELSDVPLPRLDDDEVSTSMVGDETVKADDVAIWIDPLDATKEYTENLLEYVTTMVGVAVKGIPVIGVIHRPFKSETFWAVKGHGHSSNLNKAAELVDLVRDSKDTHLSSPIRIIVSRSHAGNVQNYTKTVLGSNDKFNVISAAGAGFKVLEVVEDRADVYVHVTAIKKWDLCAGYALMTAMGGTMSTLGGDKIDFSGDTEPLNTKGVLAYMHPSPVIEKMKTIRLPDS